MRSVINCLIAFALAVALLPARHAMAQADLTSDSALSADDEAMAHPDNEGWTSLHSADQLLHENNYKMALYHLMQAQARFDATADPAGLAMMHFKTGLLYQKWEVYERAIDHYKQALGMGQLSGTLRQKLLLRMAACSHAAGQLDGAMEAYSTLEGMYRQNGSLQGQKFVLAHMAELFARTGQEELAIQHYQRMIDLPATVTTAAEKASAYNNIGFLQEKIGEIKPALASYLTALSLRRQAGGDLVSSLINIGSVYNKLQDYGQSLHYLALAQTENTASHAESAAADLLNFMAIVRYNQRAYSKGLITADQAIAEAKAHGSKEVLVRCYKTKAQLLEKLLDYAQASKFYQIYADLKDSVSYDQRLAHERSMLKNMNVERVEKELRLLLTDAEKNQLVMRQSSLEAEQEIRTKQLELLEREKQMQAFSITQQALRLEQATLAKQQLEHEGEARKLELAHRQEALFLAERNKAIDERAHKTTLALLARERKLVAEGRTSQQMRVKAQREREKMLLGIVLLAIVGVGVTLVSLNRIKTANMKLRIQQDEVTQQKESVESMFQLLQNKNRSITDSIKYARRMQSALMPGTETLHQALPLSFVLTRPRDVVSGDFFFLHRTDTHVVLACVDCTGHGVPGAMLSLVGHQALANIVEREQVLDPGQILHKMDRDLSLILKRNQQDLQQGMDVSIVVLEPAAKKLRFAGAVQNLKIVRDDGVEVLRADRLSIGGLGERAQKTYHTHQVPIVPHMQCYLMTDGIARQLGGPQEKRYGKARLRELLLQVHPLAPSAKKAAIEQALEVWMAPYGRQLDDMLLIGFRADLVT